MDGHDKQMFEQGEVKVETKHAKLITTEMVDQAEANHMFDSGCPSGLQNAVLDALMKIGAKRVDDIHRVNVNDLSLLTGDDKVQFFRFDPSVMKNEQVYFVSNLLLLLLTLYLPCREALARSTAIMRNSEYMTNRVLGIKTPLPFCRNC